jgi:hypothetical protein
MRESRRPCSVSRKAAQCAIRSGRRFQNTTLEVAFHLWLGRREAQQSMRDAARNIKYGFISGLLSLTNHDQRAQRANTSLYLSPLSPSLEPRCTCTPCTLLSTVERHPRKSSLGQNYSSRYQMIRLRHQGTARSDTGNSPCLRAEGMRASHRLFYHSQHFPRCVF